MINGFPLKSWSERKSYGMMSWVHVVCYRAGLIFRWNFNILKSKVLREFSKSIWLYKNWKYGEKFDLAENSAQCKKYYMEQLCNGPRVVGDLAWPGCQTKQWLNNNSPVLKRRENDESRRGPLHEWFLSHSHALCAGRDAPYLFPQVEQADLLTFDPLLSCCLWYYLHCEL